MTIRTALVTLLAIALFAWFLSRANLSSVLSEIAHARTDLIVWSIMAVIVVVAVIVFVNVMLPPEMRKSIEPYTK